LSPGFNLVKQAQIGVRATLRLWLRPPWLLLKASLSVCRTLLLDSSVARAARRELFGKQRISPRLLSVAVLLLSVLVQPIVVLLSVPVELVVRLLSVLVELLLVLVVLVESLLLSVVVLRELLTVVLLTIVLLAVVLLAIVLLTIVLLTIVLLTVVLFLFTVSEGTNVDVSGKAWNILSSTIPSDCLWHSSVRDSVLVEDCLRRSVSGSTKGPGAPVAAVAQIPSVALTSWVGRPGAVGCTNGINVPSSCAIEPASSIKKASGTITGDPRAKSRDLFFHPRFMLYTTRDVRPRSIVLAERNIVSTSLTDDLAGLSRKRL